MKSSSFAAVTAEIGSSGNRNSVQAKLPPGQYSSKIRHREEATEVSAEVGALSTRPYIHSQHKWPRLRGRGRPRRFRALEHALNKLQFNAARERFFGVGDLVNRGPHSDDAVDWFEQRFTGVTLGNHDRAASSWFEERLRRPRATDHGWNDAVDPRHYPSWCNALPQIPVALNVETSCGPVGVIDAEAPDPMWSRTFERLEAGPETDSDDALFGFKEYSPAIRRMKSQHAQGQRALVPGHFVVEEVEATANRWNLDTGAGFENRNRLSLLEINAGELKPLTLEVRETP